LTFAIFMGDGSRGTDETALLYGDAGRSQAHNQVVNQLWKISRALVIAKSNPFRRAPHTHAWASHAFCQRMCFLL